MLGTHILHPPVAAGAQQGLETITAELQGSGLRALGRMSQGRIRKVAAVAIGRGGWWNHSTITRCSSSAEPSPHSPP